MKKTRKKLALNRDTVRNLAAPALQDVAAGQRGTILPCSINVSCGGTCQGQTCQFTCTFPSFCPCPTG